MMSDAIFRDGFARLCKFSLSFDAWLYHTQIRELTDLARTFPAVPIVIDHVGGPLGIGLMKASGMRSSRHGGAI